MSGAMSSLALSAAVAGSICLALMLIFDRLMMSDCYRDDPDHAWVISAAGGAGLGLAAVAITWAAASVRADWGIPELLDAIARHAVPQGLALWLAGALNVQVLRHYLRLFLPHNGVEPDETAIAMWLSALPVFVMCGAFALGLAGAGWGALHGLPSQVPSAAFVASVIACVLAIVGFEWSSSGRVAYRAQRVGDLAMLILSAVASTLLVSYSLRSVPGSGDPLDASQPPLALALQPFYWLGFVAGLRPLLKVAFRRRLAHNWPRIRLFLPIILVVELIGMGVYFFEFWGLSGVDPTTVHLITAAHVLLVFVLSYGLAELRRAMELRGARRIRLCGLRLKVNRLPNRIPRVSSHFWLLMVAGLLLLAVMLRPEV